MAPQVDLQALIRSLQRSVTAVTENAPRELREEAIVISRQIRIHGYRLDSRKAAATVQVIRDPASVERATDIAAQQVSRGDWYAALQHVRLALGALPLPGDRYHRPQKKPDTGDLKPTDSQQREDKQRESDKTGEVD
jgi:hypothetical protein